MDLERRARRPRCRRYVDSIGANFGRVRIIKLEPQDHEQALQELPPRRQQPLQPGGQGWVVRTWIELTDDPDSYMLLMDLDEDHLPIPSTERRVPLPQVSRFVVDTQRLWHVVVHNGTAAALRASSPAWRARRTCRAGSTARSRHSSEPRVR